MPKKQKQNKSAKNRSSMSPNWSDNNNLRGAPTLVGGLGVQQALLRSTPLFPASSRKKLFYYEPGINLAGTAGVIAQYVFSANGLYDPNITGTGHQPLGFDTMMLYYEQYTVLASKIRIRAAGNGIQPAVVSLCLAPDTTTGVITDTVENGLGKSTIVDGRSGGGYGTGERLKSLELSCDVPKYFGRRGGRSILDDTLLYGTVAANPTEQVYYQINTWGFGTFTDNTSVPLDVLIEYDAVFWEPRKVAAQLLPTQAVKLPPLKRVVQQEVKADRPVA